ncbi:MULTISPECIES: hypothetical protein [Streptomycetaceae]|uniref:Uncharacterized protein n=1 Tax=Streptantibioticus cattleyicolor (strain ATCC 35852 / DSM 46488 / JCM 4925 / NBRC 14057 / NRRL 8057) TaxID=1003195 RepID=F8JXC6_STREN|nr:MULTISPECIES: hypothetical protein [Streptomycetaceae]AEW94600.1 hypothetical protein SCATT_22290 [Streptantibioticus cattleyicolor NRRL 8057 = DSM 46488]MYS59238.1 hypothetical protein [Streptomyces sp. SID5468]CCB74957.1 protein of unknown function [Streptantibioticus cattleyicolor NRRL 8057 = DSM 46488]
MNPINYARGLLDELETAVRTGAKDLEQQVRAELEAIAPEARKAIAELRGLVDPKTITTSNGEEVPTTAVADIHAVGRRLDEVLGDFKRTAKTAGAPQTATPPAAK